MDDKKQRKLIIIIYSILSMVFIVALPYILSFGNETLKKLVFNKIFLGVQVILGIANIFVIIFLILKNRDVKIPLFGKKKQKTNKYGDQGSAAEGNIYDLEELAGDDGFTISKNVRLSANASYEHVAVIGPTGSGKSSSFFIPNLLDMDGSHSVVVTDPKGEMHEKTSAYLESLGYDVIKLSPLKPEENDMYYNPIMIAETDTQLRQVAQNILTNGNKSMEIATGGSSGGSEWLNMAAPLLSATLIYVKKYGQRKTIGEALDIILQDNLEEMEMKFKRDPGALRSFLIFKSSAESEKTLSSIKSVLTTNMQLFIDSYVEEFTQTPFTKNALDQLVVDKTKLFDPKTIRERPTALFICVEETESTYMMPLMSILYTQILTTCMGTKGQPILFYLDEFANIGIIDNMASITATARSRQIGLSVGLQGVEQLARNYGEKNGNDILNNLKTKLVYSGLTGETAQYVSNLSGFTTVESKSVSNDPNAGLFGGQNISKSGVRRELLTTDEVRRMDEDDVIIIAHNKNLVRDTKNKYFTQKKYLDKIEN